MVAQSIRVIVAAVLSCSAGFVEPWRVRTIVVIFASCPDMVIRKTKALTYVHLHGCGIVICCLQRQRPNEEEGVHEKLCELRHEADRRG
jgi:hypothetical protein